MTLSTVMLSVFLFLEAAGLLSWFSVSSTLLGAVALVTAILILVQGLGVHDTRISR